METYFINAIVLLACGGSAIYIVWAIFHLSRQHRYQAGSTSTSQAPQPRHTILGKSHFVLSQRHSRPEAAIESDTVKPKEKQDIFAPASVPEHPRQIPPEDLDEVFGKVPEGESNEPLDIDFPLSDDLSSDEEDDELDLENETEYLQIERSALAQGVSFEQMSEAYRSIVHDSTITDEKKEQAGRVLLEMKHTDMFEAVVSGHPERDDKVRTLIDTYLSAFQQRIAERSGESPSPQGSVPSSFDVRNYVK